MFGWRFFVDFKPWLGDSELFVTFTDYRRQQKILLPPSFAVLGPSGGAVDKREHGPFLGQTRTDVDDGLGDVTNFLQAALECAWEQGLRPRGFKDHANELTAVRYHLEDMRKLALDQPAPPITPVRSSE